MKKLFYSLFFVISLFFCWSLINVQVDFSLADSCPSSFPSGMIFCDDFESGNFNKWYFVAGGSGWEMSSDACYSGSKCARRLDQTPLDQMRIILPDNNKYNHFLVSFWFKPASNYTGSENDKFFRAGNQNGSSGGGGKTNLVWGPTMLTIEFGSPDTKVDYTDFSPSNGSWHKVEVEWELPIDGGGNYYVVRVDGRENSRINGYFWPEYMNGGDHFISLGPWFKSSIQGGWYFDDVQVYAWSGDGTTPPPPQTCANCCTADQTCPTGSTNVGSCTRCCSTACQTPSSGGVCQKLDSRSTIPAGFGAPYNALTVAKEQLMSVNCQSTSVSLSLGNGSENQFIYRYGYIWRNNTWQRMDITGSQSAYGGNWFKGNAQVSGNMTSQELSQKNSFIAFICNWTNNSWKCGCRDSACTTAYWQLQQFGNY